MVLVFDGLYNCIQVFTHYFEVLEEESLRDNFVVVVSKDNPSIILGEIYVGLPLIRAKETKDLFILIIY